nr:unnamed protein product [Callosobruchus analis]
MMFLVSQLLSLPTRQDYPPGIELQPNMIHIDVFMALFMVCALEVVVLKTMVFDDPQEQSKNSDDRPVADRFFDRELY